MMFSTFLHLCIIRPIIVPEQNEQEVDAVRRKINVGHEARDPVKPWGALCPVRSRGSLAGGGGGKGLVRESFSHLSGL